MIVNGALCDQIMGSWSALVTVGIDAGQVAQSGFSRAFLSGKKKLLAESGDKPGESVSLVKFWPIKPNKGCQGYQNWAKSL